MRSNKKWWRTVSASIALSVGLSGPVSYSSVPSSGMDLNQETNVQASSVLTSVYGTQSPAAAQVTQSVYGTVSPIELMVTELVPDNSSTDAYEYIELYNPTDRALPARDLQIRYTYANGTYQVWNLDGDQVIPPGGTAVVWVRTGASEGKTLTDFNRHFGSNVTSQQLLEVHSGGMANTGMRAVVISTDTGTQISRANYNHPNQDISAGKSNIYTLPADGSTVLIKLASGQKPTPGTIRTDQAPTGTVVLPKDSAQPAVVHTPPYTSTPPVDLTLTAQVTDDQSVKRVTLYYKTDAQEVYQQEDLTLNEAGMFSKTISKYDIMSGSKLQYYYEVSDGIHKVKAPSEPAASYQIHLQHQPIPLLNVADGQYLRETVALQGYQPMADGSVLRVSIDGQPIESKRVMPGEAYLVLEADGLQPALGFKNGILIGDTIIHLFEGIHDYSQFETVAVPVSPELLSSGANTLSVWAGDRISPTSNEGNNDNFSIRNVRLILWDGTILRDPAYDSKTSYGVNDDIQHRDFHFMIPEQKLSAITYAWDTKKAVDGKHRVSLEREGTTIAAADVIVDNTKPVIAAITPDAGSQVKGFIPLTAQVSDTISGVSKVEAKLDGNPVDFPGTVAAASLTPGSHRLEVTATDRAGNETSAASVFESLQEHPNAPMNPKPNDGDEKVGPNPMLMANVQDPYGDALKVSFYEGYKYDYANRGQAKAYSHAVDREPPLLQVPQGEKAFDEGEYSKISISDDQYVTTDVNGDFPYHRFELKVDQDLTGVSELEVRWEGHSLEGRRVTMYAWNHKLGKWTEVDSGIGTQDFVLKGKVSVADTVREGTVQVLVQDQIPSPDEYDFSFAWISDTQYYSKSYPHIYTNMTQWLVDQQAKQKIQYTIHTGDIVDGMDEYQYINADRSMKILDDAGMPYGVLAGNHDVHYAAADYSMYGKYFGRHRFENRSYYGGELDNNRDHYDLISSGGNDFVILYFGWVIDQQSIDWANQVLKKYSDRNAIVALHEYINPEGNYSGQGKEIYEKVVVPNDNVFMVLSGHIIGVSHNVKTIGDRQVLEMLADYQGLEQGGLGYLRLLKFDTEHGLLHVNTFSSYLNDYNYYEDSKEEFTIPIKLKPVAKQVATDYIQLNVLTTKLIGQESNVVSGTTAKAKWTGLTPGRTYGWYVSVEDAYLGKTLSDVWTFQVNDGKNGNSGK
ncbi:hypothetical protein PM3016_6236 [Paenibacillus mucilaginosus 3016]|uniref:LTD domain-containing protein n=1 Tax=Paenibacillus mucilaginosus 3016 TaxID=1116391 RepID=H6NBC6_9BACL|nr:Ig-like domain-containing protein [Paenibacillus mucilaginosus]AFC32872.1 hypothetical protein PM3016_6236 [Paenibacillus mucilaginosus 3016]WFA21326.1 hypothetical protein ERY13_30980 [Paenibacillus mucilaginosus]